MQLEPLFGWVAPAVLPPVFLQNHLSSIYAYTVDSSGGIPMPKYAFLSIFALTGVMMAADHPALGGAWVLDSAHSDMDATKIKSETLSINQQDEAVQLNETVTASNGKETTSAIACNTAGQTCKIKDHGEAEVAFWYNGDALVKSRSGITATRWSCPRCAMATIGL
jgi:hypothetical protein